MSRQVSRDTQGKRSINEKTPVKRQGQAKMLRVKMERSAGPAMLTHGQTVQ